MRHGHALAALTLLAAALRFPTLDVQSYWNDEAVTALLLDQGLGGVLSDVPDSESTPPLYYLLAWLWSQVLGTGEAGLRSLSALAGTATVPLVALAAERLVSRRAALVAAALAATSPLLVWYSQEARAYALLILLAAAALAAFASAIDGERRPGRPLAWWAALSALSLATHYFAVFVVIPQAAWLAWLARRGELPARPVAGAITVPGAAGLALLPLAIDQASNQGAAFIEGTSIATRVAQVPKQLLVGFDAPAEVALTAAGAAAALLAALLLVARSGEEERRGGLVAAGLAAAGFGAPVVLAVLGPDFVLTRNLLGAWPALGVALAAGLAARGAGRAGVAGAVVLAAVGASVSVAVPLAERYQRDDWRGAARALGPAERTRVIVLTPPDGRVPLSYYLPGVFRIPAGGAAADEIDVIGLAKRRPGEAPEPPRTVPAAPAVGFEQVERLEEPTFTLLRWRAAEPIGLTREGVAAGRLSDADAEVLVQPAGAGTR